MKIAKAGKDIHESPRTLARLPAAGRATKFCDRANDAIRAEAIIVEGINLAESGGS